MSAGLIVTLGDGHTARLIPMISWCRVREADGRLICNHADREPCTRTDHDTSQLYEMVVEVMTPADRQEAVVDAARDLVPFLMSRCTLDDYLAPEVQNLIAAVDALDTPDQRLTQFGLSVVLDDHVPEGHVGFLPWNDAAVTR